MLDISGIVDFKFIEVIISINCVFELSLKAGFRIWGTHKTQEKQIL